MWMDIANMVLLNPPLGGSNPTPVGLTRDGGTAVWSPTGTAFVRVDPTNNITTAVHAGRTCMVLPDAAFNNMWYTCQAVIQPMAFQATGNLVDSDGLNNWRIIVTCAAVGFEAAGADVGIFFDGILPPGGSTITGAGNVPGFGVAWSNAFGIPNWISRSTTVGGVPDELLPLPSAVADGLWHTYEFRIQWATATTDASISVLYDNVVQLTRSWGGATVLPSYATYPGMGSLKASFRKTGGVSVQNFYLNQFRVMAAPTFQALF
jgi:hypothetical protein